MHHFSATSFTLEASASSTTQMYQNFMTDDASLVQYMTEINDSAQEHVGEFNLSPPRCPECMSFRDVIPNSSLDEVGGSHLVPEANWESIEQPPQLVATSNVAGPSRPKDNLGLKIAKEAKKKELHAFFVTLFKKHGVPLGTTGMAEARLPWKKMTSILADQGLEIAGWPEGVPKPRSDGKADKGISGFNAEHIAALYKAMKAGQINFRLLAGGSPTNDASRVWQREDDMEEEVNIRPTKKRKLAETRKKPKDFVAMQSVMKF
ncbi:hypothetical protein C8R44DRAFT_825990 [Mycena epipterygia]|nr:hypothetical protein C8R44DRAFT_825990 [Mycena epipterygia]